MKTAITIIAVCEVIRTIQITLDLILWVKARKATLDSINNVGKGVVDEFTPDNIARAIIKEVADNEH